MLTAVLGARGKHVFSFVGGRCTCTHVGCYATGLMQIVMHMATTQFPYKLQYTFWFSFALTRLWTTFTNIACWISLKPSNSLQKTNFAATVYSYAYNFNIPPGGVPKHLPFFNKKPQFPRADFSGEKLPPDGKLPRSSKVNGLIGRAVRVSRATQPMGSPLNDGGF